MQSDTSASLRAVFVSTATECDFSRLRKTGNALGELELITEQELARQLKICRRQLYNWRVGGLIPYFKMGKAVHFRVADVAAAIERMRIG